LLVLCRPSVDALPVETSDGILYVRDILQVGEGFVQRVMRANAPSSIFRSHGRVGR
jgi:hypothetical protein